MKSNMCLIQGTTKQLHVSVLNYFHNKLFYIYELLNFTIVTSRKVAGSIPEGVIGIFHWYNPSVCTMALRSTQHLTEMSNMNISCGVKAAGALGWQPYHLHVPIVLKSGSLNFVETSGPVQACTGIVLPFKIFKPQILSNLILLALLHITSS
jgi:hypothetical protein